MRAPIGGNDAIRIAGDVLVEEDRFLLELHDLPRRTDAGDTRLTAVEDGIGPAFVIGQVLHLRQMFRFIGRTRRRRLDAAYRAGVAVARALIDLVNRDLAVDLFLQRGRRAIDCVTPDAAQVGMSRLLCRDDALDENRTCDESKDSVRHHLASAPLINSYDVPSGSLILSMQPHSEPSLAFTASTEIVWPIAFAKSARARPTLLYPDGGLLSNFHCSTLPPF